MPNIEHSITKEAYLELQGMAQEERSEIYDSQRENLYRELEKRRKKSKTKEK